MLPVFSIITVCYNAKKTIERTIKSIVNQTYSKIEYIIIDGGSTDQTLNIITKYKNRITKLISEKDKGIYDAMNKGLSIATGDYVWFMNAGDTIYTIDTVKTIAEKVCNLPKLPDIIYGETTIVNINEQFLYMRRLKAPEKLIWKNFRNGMLVCHQSFIVKKDITSDYNLHYKFSADFDWCIRCLKLSKHNYNTHLILANYLNEGVTTKNLKASLKERYNIMCQYYGKTSTIIYHIKFGLRFGISKLKGKL